MAANRKASRGTDRRSGRGPKAMAKSASMKERDESRIGGAAKARSEKPRKDSKPGGPVAKTGVKPIKSKVAGPLTETSLKSGTLKAAAAKPAGASASVKPVKVGGKIDAQGIPAGKPPKPEPLAGDKAPATAAVSAPLSGQQSGLVAVVAAEAMPLANEKKGYPTEQRLRDIPRYADLAGPDMVPLSTKVSKVVWAFDVVDAITGTSAIGKTRIFAIPTGKEAEKNEHIEVAIFSSRSGRLVVQTRTTLENDELATSLVSMAGGTLRLANVAGLRFENDLYDSKSLTQEEFGRLEKSNPIELSPAPSYPFPSAHDPDGSMAFILGLAPAAFDAGGIAKMIDPPFPDAGGKSLIDAQRRFALWGPAGDVPKNKIGDDEPSFEVKLEISDAPGGSRTLTLTYRATREKSDGNSGTKAGAKNTDRMKLTNLDSSQPIGKPPIEAKDVPPVYLLLQ
jgi:hypothetical protein